MALQNSPNIQASRIQGHLQLSASTTSSSQLNLITGTAPTTPVTGDIYNVSGVIRIPLNPLTLGTGTTAYTGGDLNVLKASGSVFQMMQSNDASGGASSAIGFAVNGNAIFHIGKYGTSASNFSGTSISQTNASFVHANSAGGADGPLLQMGTPIYGIVGVTSTNMGTRLDATGLRIGTLSTLHTANSYPFQADDMYYNGDHITNNRWLFGYTGGNIWLYPKQSQTMTLAGYLQAERITIDPSAHSITFMTSSATRASIDTSGNFKVNSLSGTGSRTVEVDSTGSMTATSSTSGNAAGKIFAYNNFI